MKKTLVSFFAASTLLAPAFARADADPTGGKFTLEEATKGLKGKGTLLATINTSMGAFKCELFEKDAPGTVANFVGLARGLRPWLDKKSSQWVKKPLYDGLVFHRVIPDFMIQGGDPAGNGSGDPGFTITDETNGPHHFDKGGMLAMANRGPNTAGSQFFITEVEKRHLDDGGGYGHYQIFGQCDNVELVKKIARLDKSPGAPERPAKDVVIKKIAISRAKK